MVAQKSLDTFLNWWVWYLKVIVVEKTDKLGQGLRCINALHCNVPLFVRHKIVYTLFIIQSSSFPLRALSSIWQVVRSLLDIFAYFEGQTEP